MVTYRFSFCRKKNKLFLNALFSVLQVIFLSLSYFIIYTLLLRKLGTTKLGVWSIILATSSVVGVASAGLTSSLVKYIANYSSVKDFIKINNLIKTGLICLTVLNLLITAILYLLGMYFIPKVVPVTELNGAIALLPLSLLSLFLNAIAGIFLSAIDGLHFSFLRSLLYILSSFIFLIIAYFFINIYALKGIAYAQIIQGVFLIISSLIVLKSVFRKFSLLPMIWKRENFDQIFNYSLNFQAISICSIFTEPLAKFLLSRYSGLDFVGVYEIASRLISQVRSLMVSANQILVPFVSNKFSSSDNPRDNSYPTVLRYSYYIASISMLFLIIFSPIISFYWIGKFDDIFVYSTILVGLAMIVNIVSTPSYFSSMGMGKLKGILLSHVSILIINGILGVILGSIYKGWGVVSSYAIAMIVGSIITIVYYHRVYNFSIISILRSSGIINTVFIILGISFTIVCYQLNYVNSRLLYSMFGFIALITYTIWIYNQEEDLRLKFKHLIKKV